MFEIERKKCYADIQKCNDFLQNYSMMIDGKIVSADKVLPEQSLAYFERESKRKNGAKILHSKAKIDLIRRLAEMQETENIAEHAKNDRG